MTSKPVPIFWSVQGEFIYRHHNEPRVLLYVPKEETFPIPLKFFAVTGSAHTDLDALQEGGHWPNSCGGFIQFTQLKEKPPKGYMWSWRRLTKIQATTRPDHVWPEVWTKICNAAQIREKQEWPKEKPKLDKLEK